MAQPLGLLIQGYSSRAVVVCGIGAPYFHLDRYGATAAAGSHGSTLAVGLQRFRRLRGRGGIRNAVEEYCDAKGGSGQTRGPAEVTLQGYSETEVLRGQSHPGAAQLLAGETSFLETAAITDRTLGSCLPPLAFFLTLHFSGFLISGPGALNLWGSDTLGL